MLDHDRRDGLRAIKHALQVHGDHRIKIGLAHLADDLAVFHLDQLRVAQDARVIDQDVDLAKAIEHCLHGGFDLSLIRHVDFEEGRLTARLFDRGHHSLSGFLGHVPHGDRRSRPRKGLRRLAPDAVSAAGNDGDAIFQFNAH